MIEDIFKIGVYYCDLNIDTNSYVDYCYDIQKKDKGRTISNEGGYQSFDKNLIHDIKPHVNEYAKQLTDVSVKFSNIWVNINGHRDSNMPHNHPKSLISGALYLQTPKDCGDIVFYHPANSLIEGYFGSDVKPTNEYRHLAYYYPARVNRMYLFPSWLSHSVESNNNKKEKRISMSFNFV
jgi:uncharacterized protein (TIGR02466 family)